MQNPTDPQSYNRYAYVRNNPLKYTDPSGHIAEELLGPDPVEQTLLEGTDDDPSKNDVQPSAVKTDTTTNPSLISETTESKSNTGLGAAKEGDVASDNTKILGVYRDPNAPSYYSDDKVIYEKKDMKYGGIAKGALKPEHGILGTMATGEFAEGSKKIEVYGTNEEPKSWEIFIMKETDKKDTAMDWSKYEWSPHYISESEAVKLDVTKTTIEYFRKREKYGE